MFRATQEIQHRNLRQVPPVSYMHAGETRIVLAVGVVRCVSEISGSEPADAI